MKKLGRPKKYDYPSHRITLRLKQETNKRLEIISEKLSLSKNDLLEKIVLDFTDKMRQKSAKVKRERIKHSAGG